MLEWNIIFGIRLKKIWKKIKGDFKIKVYLSDGKFEICNSKTSENECTLSIADIFEKKYKTKFYYSLRKDRLKFEMKNDNAYKEYCIKFISEKEALECVDVLSDIGFVIYRNQGFSCRLIEYKSNLCLKVDIHSEYLQSNFDVETNREKEYDITDSEIKQLILEKLSDPKFYLLQDRIEKIMKEVNEQTNIINY